MNRPTTSTWLKVMAGTAVLSMTLTACGSSDEGDEAKDNTDKSSESASPSDSESESGAASSESFTNDKCAGNQTSKNALKVSGILPVTGNLAFLGPPEIAGVGLAVSDVNAAGGVDGTKACQEILDSGDATDASVANNSAQKAIQGKASWSSARRRPR